MKPNTSSPQPKKIGFTLIEIIVVVGIMVILLGGATYAVTSYRARARDVARVAIMKDMKNALALYYQKNGHYPPACNDTAYGYSYQRIVDPNNLASCLGQPDYSEKLMHTNSISGGWDIPGLYPEFITNNTWNDPRGTDPLDVPNRKWNCVYTIERTSSIAFPFVGCPPPQDYKQIQRYYLHCRLEQLTKLSTADGGGPGGSEPSLFELYEPYPWLCVWGA